MHLTFAIFVAGGLGALVRYGVGVWCARAVAGAFPFGTLVVNAAGCLAMGLLMATSARWPAHVVPVLGVGFLGGLTTFSAFGYEASRFLIIGDMRGAMLNICANVLLGVGAVLLGLWFGEQLFPTPQ